MFRQSAKVFLAVAFGSYLGGLVGLEISAMFCWVGILLGGAAGYLSYEWKAVIRAIPQAYRAVNENVFPKHYLRCLKWISFASLNLSVYFVFFFLFLAATQLKGEDRVIDWFSLEVFWLAGLLIGILWPVLAVVIILANNDDLRQFSYYPEMENRRITEDWKKRALLSFPPAILVWHLPKLLIFLARKVPWFVGGCRLVAREWSVFWAKFFWQMFLLVHSEMRLLCGVDAMLGSAIGFFAGSAIVGALAGGLFGVFNYLVVTEFCLKRIWRLIPVRK
jgi:hypothetical protein